MARGASSRGKRIAFGDGRRISWDGSSPLIFERNPNIAPPGAEGAKDLEWIDYRKGNRQYNSHDISNRRWRWNYDFHAKPGEMFFAAHEVARGKEWQSGKPMVVVEPTVPRTKLGSVNKQWHVNRYESVAESLRKRGFDVVQFVHGPGSRVPAARYIEPGNFRRALAILEHAVLYIGPEGGLHHGAAAVGIPAVVIFGGWAAPSVTGYQTHANITGGDVAPCGALYYCEHCKQAMERISVDVVLEAALGYLDPP